MLASTQPGSEDLVLQYLLENPAQSTKNITQGLHANGVQISLPGVHKLVRKMLDKEVLIKKDKKIFVSQEWLLRLQKLLPSQSAFELGAGESIRWVFNDLSHLDAFWKHIVFQVLADYPNEPVFMAAPHGFWPYAPERQMSEKDFYEYFPAHDRHVYYAIAGQTAADQYMRDYLSGSHVHVESTRFSRDPLAHIVIIGDLVSTTKLSKKDEDRIHMLYERNLSQKKFQVEITKMLAEVRRATFVMEHNTQKAREFRRLISRDFAIPRPVVKQFDLWDIA